MKKNVLSKVALVTLLLLIVSVAFIIQACSPKGHSVTFMLNDKEVAKVTSKDGLVTLPNSPEKYGYEFAGWFTDKELTKRFNPKKDKIKADTIIYGKFIEKMVKVFIDGEDKGEKKLLEIKDYKPTKPGLTLDAWYVDEDCKTKYENQDISKIYAQFKAKIVFNNGYEDIYETFAPIKKPLNKPTDEEIVGDIVYMDKDNLYFKDIDGNDFDFNKNIEGNTRINVLFSTPRVIEYIKKKDGNYVAKINDDKDKIFFNSLAILSFTSKIRLKDGSIGYVDSIQRNYETIPSSLSNIYIPEGIKHIKGLNFDSDQQIALKSLKLPSTVKVIEYSFINFKNVDIQLNDNLEVIIDSLYQRGKDTRAYDEPIKIPDSVINLSRVFTNFTFSSNSAFYIEKNSKGQNMVLKKDENLPSQKVLVAIDMDNSGNVYVDEGIKNIQVSTFFNQKIKRIFLPSSFDHVVYNEDANKYPYIIKDDKNKIEEDQYLKDFDDIQSVDVGYSSRKKISIIDVSNRKNFVGIIFNNTEIPSNISSKNIILYKFDNVSHLYSPWNERDWAIDQVFFKGKIQSGQDCNIKVKIIDVDNDDKETEINHKVASGTNFSKDDLTNLIVDKMGSNTVYIDDPNAILELETFGKYTFGTIESNVYLKVFIERSMSGITYQEDTALNGYIITGFDDEEVLTIKDTGGFIVKIPKLINGKKCIKISDKAFMPDEDIIKNSTVKTEPEVGTPNYDANLQIYKKYMREVNKKKITNIIIGDNIIIIGKNAFANLENLKVVKFSKDSLLEDIGESAFECKSETAKLTSVSIPVKTLKNVGKFAFNSYNLESIEEVKDNNDAAIFKIVNALEINKDFPINRFFIHRGQILKLTKFDTKNFDGKDCTVADLQLYATGPKSHSDFYQDSFFLGGYYRVSNTAWMFRVEVLEGSIYLNGGQNIVFVSVSKIHKGAFYNMDKATYSELVTYQDQNNQIITVTKRVACWKKIKETPDGIEILSLISENDFKDLNIFEDGWWNNLMKGTPEYDENMQFMGTLNVDTSGMSIL